MFHVTFCRNNACIQTDPLKINKILSNIETYQMIDPYLKMD